MPSLFKRFIRAVISDYISAKTETLQLRKLELSVKMENWEYNYGNGTCELPRRPRKFILEAIALLAEQGTVLKIWQQKARFAGKLLYEPGYSASWPHWADVARRHWSGESKMIFDIKSVRKNMPGRGKYRSEYWYELQDEVKDVDA
jgi:hypothetical protein